MLQGTTANNQALGNFADTSLRSVHLQATLGCARCDKPFGLKSCKA